jgi:hypothetical protein
MKRLPSPAVLVVAVCCLAPAAIGAALRAAPEPFARIPLEITGDHAFVEVELAGGRLTFAFDSGAGGVALNEATARRLGIAATGEGSAIGAAGARRVPLVGGLSLRLGKLRLEGITAALVALDHLEEVIGRPVDGIVGRDVLRGRVVLLDHDREVLEVHDRATFPFMDWGSACPLRATGPIEIEAAIELSSGESLSGRFHVDSGARAYLVLNSAFGEAHALDGRVGPTYTRAGRALTGVSTVDRVGRVAGVRFCGYRFPSPQGAPVPAVLSGATGGVLARPGSGGLIGNAILRRFNIVFDLDRHRMYLRPNSRWRAPVRTDASGLQLLRRPGGATLVEHVVAGSPADLAGLMRGDELRTIDDTDAAAITLAELRDLLQEPGREFGLVVSRGGESRAVQLETRAFAGLGDVVDASVNAQTGSPPP